jgi:glycosidase
VRGAALGLGLLAAPAPARAGGPDPSGFLYLVMVDRHLDGDRSNNAGVDRADPQAFHGGDFAGLTADLPRIAALGASAIWLTPITAAQDARIGPWGAFHGYWMDDPSVVAARFGGEDGLRALREAAAAQRLGLVVDLVWNHVSPSSPLRAAHPDWFHPAQPIADWEDPAQRITHEVHGLPDLAQEHPAVADWLLAGASRFAAMEGVVGVRIDAVRHMDPGVLQGMIARLRAAAPTWVLAEDFDGDPARLEASRRAIGADAIFDFPLHYALTDAVCRGGSLGRLAAVLSADPPEAPATRVTFLDNHDRPRIASACGGVAGGVERALALLFSLRGLPAITWGTESRAAGAVEPANRASLDLSARDPRLEGLIRELVALRRAVPVLATGETRVAEVSAERVQLLRGGGPGEPLAVLTWNAGALPWEPRLGLGRGAQAVDTRRWGADGAMVMGRAPAALAPGELRLVVYAPGALVGSRWEDRSSRAVLARTAAVAPAGASLRLCGTHPSLGAWVPARCPAVGPGGVVALRWAPGTASMGRLVRVWGDGRVEWAAGDDELLHVGAENGAGLMLRGGFPEGQAP